MTWLTIGGWPFALPSDPRPVEADAGQGRAS